MIGTFLLLLTTAHSSREACPWSWSTAPTADISMATGSNEHLYQLSNRNYLQGNLQQWNADCTQKYFPSVWKNVFLHPSWLHDSVFSSVKETGVGLILLSGWTLGSIAKATSASSRKDPEASFSSRVKAWILRGDIKSHSVEGQRPNSSSPSLDNFNRFNTLLHTTAQKWNKKINWFTARRTKIFISVIVPQHNIHKSFRTK